MEGPQDRCVDICDGMKHLPIKQIKEYSPGRVSLTASHPKEKMGNRFHGFHHRISQM